jgi:WD40 repeat protein
LVNPSDARLKVWDAHQSRVTATLNGRPPVAWSADGKTLASADPDHTAILFWDAAGGELKRRFAEVQKPALLSWSPDNVRLACADSSGLIRVWDADTGELRKELQPPQAGACKWLLWAPNASSLAVVPESGNILVWDLRSDSPATPQSLANSGGPFYYVPAWSPDSRRLAGGPRVGVWSIQDGGLLRELAGREGCVFLYWSKDGTSVTVVDGYSCSRRWEVETGELLAEGRGPLSGSKFLSASVEGDLVAYSREPFDVYHTLYTQELSTGRARAAYLPLADDSHLFVSAAGHWCGTPQRIERMLIYVARGDDDVQRVFAPDEFAAQFGWQNEPSRVRLLRE